MENRGDHSHLQQRKKRRLVLFPQPLQGHINPMLQLASILYHKAGFSITIIHTNFNSPNSSSYPHFSFRSIPDGLSETEASTADLIAFSVLLNVKCVVPFQDCLAELLGGGGDDDDVACLITDANWYFTQAVADSLKLPRIVLCPTSICFFNTVAAPPMQEFYFNVHTDFQFETPVLEIQTRDPENINRFIKNIVKQTKASSGIIWNSFQELEELALTNLKQEFPIPHFLIGPFHKYFPASSSSLLAQDQTSISWLDKQPPKSVIYVSFGSLIGVNETEFQEIAWGLANSKLPFLWVVRPGLVQGTEWLEPLPKNFLEMIDGRGHIVKWAPQQEVLDHSSVGAFWTHCGWNSTLESICEGVPMICGQPCFGDQLVNARYVSDVWRFGLHLEKKLERGEIERAIRRVIREAEGQKMRERIMILKDKMDICLTRGGSSYQSLESLTNYIMSF
ncbi:hypothetical protein Ddye_032257 [Dipteronia dyeriana]|uniref:UDP-glycosyltransferase n=1 Tax=Dipteronia dyeriana TaxID=168575 RepID=A0AAD9TL19_9ROSI|nr:hypothetical protein Ddye_032257 [Dipteronia dyeriana]